MILSIDLSGNAPTVLGQSRQRMARAEALAAKRMAEDYVEEIRDWIDAGKSFTPRSGQLEDSIDWRPIEGGAEVYANAGHAGFVEHGTKPHIIRPKPGREGLRFFGGGGVVLREVHHPGTDPLPYFFADLDRRKGVLLRTARETFAEVFDD